MVHEEAVELHIQDSDFERIISNLEATNDAIKKCLSNTNVNFTSTKPEDAIKRILQTDSEFNWWEWESLSQEKKEKK